MRDGFEKSGQRLISHKEMKRYQRNSFSEISDDVHIQQSYFDHIEWIDQYTFDDLEQVVSIECNAPTQALKEIRELRLVSHNEIIY